MKHTDRHFWLYAAAYIMLGSGTILIVADVAQWVLTGRKLSLIGSISIFIGIMALNNLKRSGPKEPSPDNTEDGNDREETPPED